MRSADHHHTGFADRRRQKSAHAVRLSPAEIEKAWRALIAAVKAVEGGAACGPGLRTALAEARRAVVAAPFPSQGEDAKAAALCLCELARTLPFADDNRHGWHLAALRACAGHCDAMLDQQRNAVFAGFRNGAGSD